MVSKADQGLHIKEEVARAHSGFNAGPNVGGSTGVKGGASAMGSGATRDEGGGGLPLVEKKNASSSTKSSTSRENTVASKANLSVKGGVPDMRKPHSSALGKGNGKSNGHGAAGDDDVIVPHQRAKVYRLQGGRERASSCVRERKREGES